MICTAAAALLLATAVWAQGDGHPHAHSSEQSAVHQAKQPAAKLDAHTLQDIERHESMARAHAQAAQCLAAGAAYDTCQKQLQASCKGLALGKHCGMRHAH